MRLATILAVKGDPSVTADHVVGMEHAGLDVVFVGEAAGFDAPSFLGYLAARTDKIQLAAGALNVYSRSPSLLAMTPAGLDALCNGRFILGLGVLGPLVIEGFHGVPFDHPVARTRDVIEVCRKAWRREPVTSDGSIVIPLPRHTGKPMKLAAQPVRDAIPIYVAGMGVRNVEIASEVADGWLSYLFVPERARDVWGAAMDLGRKKRDSAMAPLEVVAGGKAAVTATWEDATQLRDLVRPELALYIGGMGSRETNFYNKLISQYGFEEEAKQVQDLYLAGKRGEAEAAISSELLAATTLIGPRGWLAERIEIYKDVGVTCLCIDPVHDDVLEHAHSASR